MKKATKVIRLIALIAVCASFASCATLFTKKTTQVVLVNPPADLKVYEDGKELQTQQVMSHTKSKGIGDGQTITTYYATGVYVSKKQKHHKLTLSSQGKSGDINMRTKVSGGIVFLDIIFTGGLGAVIDGITKKWRVIKHPHVDVPAVIAGTQPKSQRQLRKTIKQQAGG
ncbi:MAG: hypothetical protein ACXVNM_12645 [Bacteroidia bacterium]